MGFVGQWAASISKAESLKIGLKWFIFMVKKTNFSIIY